MSNKEIILLDQSQIENLLGFLDLYFIDSIRKDEDIDNMEYLCSICRLYSELKEARKKVEEDRSNTETEEVKMLKRGAQYESYS